MSVVFFPRMVCRLLTLALMLLGIACSVSEIPGNQYQAAIEVSQLEARPVTELQNQALAAINEDRYQLAVNYLQRAIRIQPRNAWSWHYLAISYSRDNQLERCRAMIARSRSYGAYDDALTSANDRLMQQCRQG